MITLMRPAISTFIGFSLLTGVLYPSLVTSIAQTLFPYQANGSMIRVDEQLRGSALVGQQFTNPKYFWGRISATSSTAYNASASSGSNIGPTNNALVKAAKNRIDELKQYSVPKGRVPVDLVTSSASGLDPHITPAAAEYQIPRVASFRNMTEDAVRNVVVQNTQSRQLGILGEPRVNVLQLNSMLDQLHNVQEVTE